MKEIWKTIEEFPQYEVSNMGRIAHKGGAIQYAASGRCGPFTKTIPRNIRKLCRNWQKSGRLREMTIGFRKNKQTCTRSVHRLVALAFLGKPKAGQHVLHWDGNPANNCVSNLRWGTPTENARDALRHGTQPRRDYSSHVGVNNPKAKLKEADVIAIRAAVPYKGYRIELAKKYGIKPATVYFIRSGRHWKHLPMPNKKAA